VAHPYREPTTRAEEPPARQAAVAPDDVIVAVMLLVIGTLVVAIGISTDRGVELSLGMVLLGLSAKVAYDARRAVD
jgi:hypothetical protein